MQKFFTLLCCVCLLFSAGCGWLKGRPLDIYQGNVIAEAKVSQLHTGMTKGQVAYLMGYPITESTFDANRWDYVYFHQLGNNKPTRKKAVIYFKGGKLVRVVR